MFNKLSNRKIQIAIVLPILMSVFYSCTTTDPTPEATSCTVESIQVKTFPTLDDGSQWDFSIGDDQFADLFFQIETDTLVLHESTFVKDNVGADDLPVTISTSSYLLASMDETYYITLYDNDGTSADDFISLVSFVASDYATDQPEFISLSNTVMSIDVYVTWGD